jgi:energy-coupling factor transport system ATP-binding protein
LSRPPLVRVDRLGVRHLTRRAPALRELAFELGSGERVLLAGASGSGKSTLALCLAGLIPASVDADVTGSVEIGGRPTTAFQPGALAEHVGIVFQDPSSQFTMLAVEDEVAFGLENLGVPASDMPKRVAEALAAVGLGDRADWRIDRLSGGQQQRVALAATLVMRPRVLVLDEPTAHLDPRTATELYEVIHAVCDATGALVVAIEHDVDRVVPRHAGRGLLLDRQGRLVVDSMIGSLFSDSEAALRWQAHGVRLPASTALALALGQTDPDLPVSIDQGAAWLAGRRWAQDRLRGAAANPTRRSAGKAVLRARGLWQRYIGPATSFVALRGVELSVAEGELVALVGANGSGKTTLLRSLTGLLTPDRGEVELDGRPLRDAPPRQIARLVAHVFQNPEAGFVADTVADEIAYGPRALGWSEQEIDQHTRLLLERFGLTALARANPFALSEGQKRRLSVAASLVLGPRVLLLDEPTFGQDRESAQALMDEIRALCDRGLAVVVASHDLGLVSEVADRVVALADGEVIFDGQPSTLLADERLLRGIGQEPPALDRVLRAARALGADVPATLRWCEVRAAGAVVGV